MPNLDINNNVFTKSLTLNEQTKILNLQTAGNFIDKNISIQITAPAITDLNVDLYSISSNSVVSVGTLSDNFYPIRTNNLSISGHISPETSGWIDANNYYGISILNVGTYTIGKMAAATLSASGSASATTTVAPGDVTVLANSTSASGKTRITSTPTTAVSEINTYYIAVQARAAANSSGTTSTITGTATASVTTAGYAALSLTGSGNITGTATAKTSQKDSSVYYLPVTSGALTVAGGGLTAGNGSASVTSNGLYNGSSVDNSDKITLSTTPATNYYQITASGSGSVNRAAITKRVTTGGWIPYDSSAITPTGLGATSLSSNTATATYYIKKSTDSISNNNGTSIITVTSGYYSSDRVFNVAGGNAVTPITSYAQTGMNTYFDSYTSDSGASVTITPQYSVDAGAVSAASTTNTGGIGYWKIKTTTRSAGNGAVTLTRGTGDSASSSNSSLIMATTTPSSGVYYTLTATGKGAVSTGTGWITSGSTESSTSTTYGYITKSVHGTAVSGSLPSSISGRTSGTYQDIEIQPNGYLKIPAGYNPIDRYVYANKADVASEAQTASNFSLSVSSISGSSAVGVGTLTNNSYPIIANNLSVTATLTAGTAGWFSSGSATDSDTDNVTVGTMPAATITFTGGVLSSTATASFINSNNKVISTASTDSYNNGLLVTAQASTNKTAVTYTNTAGYIPAHSTAQTASASATNAAATTTNYYLTGVKIAAPSSGVAKFDITVPNGSTSDFITFQFSVDSSGNVTVAGP